ncbi:hypothetical protein KP509_31G025100 [Ceratopteris richardii]|uniref:Uncharacterized protein n=1 Tax=Ceratopteris richardii TaxID=49495 RepID=A0A8T2QY77_CERRI|nr:hypothetical protein KP509_31G025100 [Ceratopteris richardii]
MLAEESLRFVRQTLNRTRRGDPSLPSTSRHPKKYISRKGGPRRGRGGESSTTQRDHQLFERIGSTIQPHLLVEMVTWDERLLRLKLHLDIQTQIVHLHELAHLMMSP